jgi:N-methylhydantoinase A
VQVQFSAAYLDRFDIELSEMLPILSAVRTTVIGRRPALPLAALGGDTPVTDHAPVATRPVYFDGDWLETPAYRRERLPLGVGIDGPALVLQQDATVLLDPGASATVDEYANLIITVAAGGRHAG